MTTFHMATQNPWTASSAATTTGPGANPMPTNAAASTSAGRTSEGSRPSLLVSSGFTSPPTTLPTALAASSSP